MFCHAWTKNGNHGGMGNWWVLSGKHMYHLTVHWLSLDNAIIKIIS